MKGKVMRKEIQIKREADIKKLKKTKEERTVREKAYKK
jgi:hypothetical protein